MPAIKYSVSFKNPLTSYIYISLEFPVKDREEVYLQLPAWRPGRYELQNFAQKIKKLEVYSSTGNAIPSIKVSKDRWLVTCSGETKLTVNYSFYARQMDAGGSWLDDSQLYINGVNCFIWPEGYETEPCELHVAVPENWQIACALPQPTSGRFIARNFDELVDSPFIASPNLMHQDFSVQGVLFHIWIQGDCEPDWNRLISDFKAFTEEQLQLFGDFPTEEYHYLFQILPYQHFHGVEHSNSTVISLGPGHLLMSPGMYANLLGVSCHELFHTWNVKQIRPKELLPYDFTQENYFRTGYVAEGVTTYYGDYLLARSGVFTWQQYQKELNQYLQKHFSDHGHSNLSVSESSFDLWLDGYKAGIPDRKVSIYQKGALAALILDLLIRKSTENKKSLDDVMHLFWTNFGKTTKGYGASDYQRAAEQIAGISLDNYFAEVINGTAPLEIWLEEALQDIGCALVKESNASIAEQVYGFKTLTKDNKLFVSGIAPGSPAEKVLSFEDEVVAVNKRKAELSLQHLLRGNAPQEIAVFRNHVLQTVYLTPVQQQFYPKYTVQKSPNPTTAQILRFESWLKQKF